MRHFKDSARDAEQQTPRDALKDPSPHTSLEWSASPVQDQKLKDMVRGWFVGGFEPTAFHTNACEVACKIYSAGDSEGRHYHKISTEITLIVTGRVRMNGVERNAGDIVLIPPFEATDFEAVEDTTTVVVKVPSSTDDKYPGSPETTC